MKKLELQCEIRSNKKKRENLQHTTIMEKNNFQEKPKANVASEALTISESVNASSNDKQVTTNSAEEAPREGGDCVKFTDKNLCILGLSGLVLVAAVVTLSAAAACNDCLTQKKGGAK